MPRPVSLVGAASAHRRAATAALAAIAAALLLSPARPALAQDAVHVGVTIHGEVRPGVHGRVDIGQRPPPVVVYPQPVVIVAPAVPVYLHVPPGHARQGSRHCAAYGACGVPVPFVRSAEYDRHDDRGRGRDEERGRGRGHGHGHGRD